MGKNSETCSHTPAGKHTFACLQQVVGEVHSDHALQHLRDGATTVCVMYVHTHLGSHVSHVVGVATSAPPTFLLASISAILLCEALSVRRQGRVR